MGELRAAPVNPAAATTTTGRSVIVVMPGGVDDPSAPSGGNTYDRRVCRDLPRIGWQVHEYAVAGTWPQPRATARAELARILAESADGAVVVLDGLVACAVPEIIVPEAERLRLVVLVHLPLGDETGLAPGLAAALNAGERRTLQAAAAVVATSDWAAVRLVTHHGLDPVRVHVAAPGADTEPPATGTATGTDRAPSLLCVASVTPRKGQLQLVESLAAVADLPWNCVCVGGLGQDPGYVTRIRELIGRYSLGDRVHLVGPRTGAELNASYAAADLLVLASHAETYGMVATEALARGVPVLATAVGGLPEAVGHAPGRGVPGYLVPPQDPAAFASALRLWLGEPVERRRSKEAALVRRTALAGWDTTSHSLAAVLERLRQESREAA
ncbi:glycosyltransferase family 4 protein [Streptomyces sp. NBC_00562]|uniref:glycosyltransferase family 4 protein n=1 Tax=Streptomyces sp. NBC_00562 TaxID=2975777 RepID=UPI002E8032F4|nr:glycosyltransferase family 4 protein [Streptomyces sp. NBC_00562]WUC23839.1 glycosyltransferase family 4 protein [Streptomyces sp. NBC_00562]